MGVTQNVLSGVQVADDELHGKVVLSHVPEELADQIGALEQVLREVDGQNRETAEREKVLWVGKVEDAELRPKPLARRPARAWIIFLVVPKLQTFSALLQVRKQGGCEFLGHSRCPYEGGRNG